MSDGAAKFGAARTVQFDLTSFVWGLIVLSLAAIMTIYSGTPAVSHDLSRWPDISPEICCDPQRFTLSMALHSKCLCSRASLAELERLAASISDDVNCLNLVYHLRGASAWVEIGMVPVARQLMHTRVGVDVHGQCAREFGLAILREVILNSPSGAPEYWGGTTESREHSGDNLGSDTIRAIGSGHPTDRQKAPVCHCMILDDQDLQGGFL